MDVLSMRPSVKSENCIGGEQRSSNSNLVQAGATVFATTVGNVTTSNAGDRNNLNAVCYTTTVAGAVDVCQICIILGFQVVCPNEATKRKHTDDHRRSAAVFLNVEEWALPATESQIGKCFPLFSPDFFQPTPAPPPPPPPQQQQQQQQQQPQPQQQQPSSTTLAAQPSSSTVNAAGAGTGKFIPQHELHIQETVAAILNSAISPNANKMGITDNASICTSSGATSSVARANDANPTARKSRPRAGGGNKRPKAAKDNEGMAVIFSNMKEQFTKSVIAAIETSLMNSSSEANFQLVRDKPSCKWPRFVIDGYAYRIGRVYSTGKCELRCIRKQGCNGKAVVEKNGTGTAYVARIVPGSMHFHSPPNFIKADTERESLQAAIVH